MVGRMERIIGPMLITVGRIIGTATDGIGERKARSDAPGFFIDCELSTAGRWPERVSLF
jgi:hypothetical protein